MKVIIAAGITITITIAFLSMVFATSMTNSVAIAQPGLKENITQPASNPATTTQAFLPTNVFQDNGQIVVTVSKNGEKPTGPVVVVPPTEPGKNNGTIINTNTTSNGNQTVVIQPNGNITKVPNANVTIVNNDTVVVAPPKENVTTTAGNVTVIAPDNQTVTTTPGNVTVVDPPVPQPPVPTCGCATQNNNNNNNSSSAAPAANNVTQPIPPLTPAANNTATTTTTTNNNQSQTQNQNNTTQTNKQFLRG